MQLDFLTGYVVENKIELQQTVFWDEQFNLVKKTCRTPSFIGVETFFHNIDYSQVPKLISYWRAVSPENDSEIFKRWLFAFMSVHTSWRANVTGYLAIKDWWKWLNKPDTLMELIKNSQVGMHNVRARFISEFSYRFWENPESYKKNSSESWVEFRNRLQSKTLGLGPAKTSFALEMCYPDSAKITCLDTHMFKAYGLDQTKDARQYEKLERHWNDMCSMWNIPAYIARCLYWDSKQNRSDSRYWSYVLEKQNQNEQ